MSNSLFSKLKSKKRWKLLIGWSIFVLVNVIIFIVSLVAKASLPNSGVTRFSAQAFGDAAIFTINVVYLNNFLRQPALLLGALTLFGYLALNRGWRDSIIGMLKTIIGYILLSIGSGVLIQMAAPVFKNVQAIGGTGVVPLDPYFSLASSNAFFGKSFLSNDYTFLISLSLVVGFVVNIIFVALKRFTKTNSLMVTGHVMLQQAAVVTTIFYIILFRAFPLLNDAAIKPGELFGLILISGIFLGVYWSVASSSTYLPTNKVTQNAGFSIGHQQMLAIYSTAKLGRFFGNPKDSAENKKLPAYLKIFEDNIFTQTIIVLSLFVILFVVIIAANQKQVLPNWDQFGAVQGLDIWNKTFGGANFTLNIIGGALKIIASIIALMTGVRMFITELQQAFHGISEKIVPGAVVAVDVAAVYGFSANSVTFGFLSGVIGQFAATGLMIGFAAIPNNNFSFIAIPLFITLFFNSGALGVYANATGGWKAALVLPGLIGFLEVLVISFALRAISNASHDPQSALILAKQKFDFSPYLNDATVKANTNLQEVLTKLNGAKNYNEKVNFATEALKILKDTNVGDLKAQLGWITQSPSPVDTGYIGMADWTFFFGILMWVGSYHVAAGWTFVIVALILLILFAQFIAYEEKKDKQRTAQQTQTLENSNLNLKG